MSDIFFFLSFYASEHEQIAVARLAYANSTTTLPSQIGNRTAISITYIAFTTERELEQMIFIFLVQLLDISSVILADICKVGNNGGCE